MLAKAGPAQADIRREVNRQAREDARSQTGPLDWLVFWRDQSQPGVAVDAKAEAERLARNRQAGQPVTAGATPVVQDTGRKGQLGVVAGDRRQLPRGQRRTDPVP